MRQSISALCSAFDLRKSTRQNSRQNAKPGWSSAPEPRRADFETVRAPTRTRGHSLLDFFGPQSLADCHAAENCGTRCQVRLGNLSESCSEVLSTISKRLRTIRFNNGNRGCHLHAHRDFCLQVVWMP